jgi:H+/Cl- antiporter ClcA
VGVGSSPTPGIADEGRRNTSPTSYNEEPQDTGGGQIIIDGGGSKLKLILIILVILVLLVAGTPIVLYKVKPDLLPGGIRKIIEGFMGPASGAPKADPDGEAVPEPAPAADAEDKTE